MTSPQTHVFFCTLLKDSGRHNKNIVRHSTGTHINTNDETHDGKTFSRLTIPSTIPNFFCSEKKIRFPLGSDCIHKKVDVFTYPTVFGIIQCLLNVFMYS